MLGAGVAGTLVALFGPVNALYANAVCFAIAIALTLLLVPRDAPRTTSAADGELAPGRGYFGQLAEGLRFVTRTPLVRAVVILVVITNTIDAAGLTVLKPVYAAGARRRRRRPGRDAGLLRRRRAQRRRAVQRDRAPHPARARCSSSRSCSPAFRRT